MEISQEYNVKHEIPPKKSPPFLVLMGGPLSGKSVVADLLSASSDYIHLDLDIIRHDVDPDYDPNKPRIYDEKEKLSLKKSYEQMFSSARGLLSQGKKVVLTATMRSEEAQDNILKTTELVGGADNALVVLLTVNDLQERQKRLNSRNNTKTNSNVRKMEQVEELSKIELNPKLNASVIDTSPISPEDVVSEIKSRF